MGIFDQSVMDCLLAEVALLKEDVNSLKIKTTLTEKELNTPCRLNFLVPTFYEEVSKKDISKSKVFKAETDNYIYTFFVRCDDGCMGSGYDSYWIWASKK